MRCFRRLFEYWRTKPEPGPSQDTPPKSQEELPADLEWIPDDLGPVGPTAPLSDFKAWFIEYGEWNDLTGQKLWLEYGNFSLVTHTEFLTKGQFFKRIRDAGFERYRESVGQRRWLYRPETADITPFVTRSHGAPSATRKPLSSG